MRMIEQFSLTLGQVLFQRRNQHFNEALELIAQSMKQLLGLNSKLVRALSVKDLLALLSTQGHLDAGKGLLLSDMLKAESDILLESGEKEDSSSGYLKSLELLLEINKLSDSKELKLDLMERVEELLPMVWPQYMTQQVTGLLLNYFTETEQLAKAEDALFFMLDDDPGNPFWIEQGLQMFAQWNELPQEELVKGGLSQKEIQQSLDILIKMKENGSLS
jgi:hypothetical protein